MQRNQNQEREKGKMSVGEAGKKGGERTAETHGREFYQEIGHKGGETVSRERGPEFYSEIGKKGGEKRGQEMHEAAERRREEEE